MFEKLVVSTSQRRKHSTVKFFLITSALYLFAIAGAFAVSILVSDPKLADTSNVLTHVAPLPPVTGTPTRIIEPRQLQPSQTRPDPNHPMDLDAILSRQRNTPPVIQFGRGSGSANSLPYEGPPGPGDGIIGVPFGDRAVEPAPSPDPPKPRPATQATGDDKRPVRVASYVLQGKASQRVVPTYPELAKRIRLQGDVSVEVIISPEGLVESARVVQGHPMFVGAALDAARRWRFEPTALNGVPVRVTGVITFVFKLGD